MANSSVTGDADEPHPSSGEAERERREMSGGGAAGPVAECVPSSSTCSSCGSRSWKYRCPGCGHLSCSLPCVNAHKRRSGCSGKRDRTAFVPITEYDDAHLLSDYTLLEEIIERRNAAKKELQPPPGGGAGGGLWREPLLPPPLAALRAQARNRGTLLHFLPSGMTRRKGNSSFYDKRRKCIFWRVEWVFGATGVRLATARADENETLGTLLGEHLAEGPVQTAVSQRLSEHRSAGVAGLRLYLRREPSAANNPQYQQLQSDQSVRSQLQGHTLIEFPTIFVLVKGETLGF